MQAIYDHTLLIIYLLCWLYYSRQFMFVHSKHEKLQTKPKFLLCKSLDTTFNDTA